MAKLRTVFTALATVLVASSALTQSVVHVARADVPSAGVDWSDPQVWKSSIVHSIEFFNRNAYDPVTGSYASEIAIDGQRKSETRHLIATSRMAYGLAYGYALTGNADDLRRSREVVRFLLTKMVRRDSAGRPYFLNAVDPTGTPVSPQTKLVVNEQAYGLNGLVALATVTPDMREKAELLSRIRELYQAFVFRFHDGSTTGKGGFYDGFDLNTGRAITTKSYNSTVYVATSFLLELAQLDRQVAYLNPLTEIGDAVATDFPDPHTGWIVENFTSDWRPDWRGWQKQPEGTIGIVGHNFQAAWLLLRLSEEPWIGAGRQARYRAVAKTFLEAMLSKAAVDRQYGGFHDVFVRETSRTMWHTNKAWWQQAEGVMALTLAQKLGVLLTADATGVRDQAVNFYFASFIDRQRGGEYDVVTREGQPTAETMKGHLGKSTYHTVEFARFMMSYSAAR